MNIKAMQLMDKVLELEKEVAALQKERTRTLTKLSELTCPYKVGDRIQTDKGLGMVGLEVQAVVACTYPTLANTWQVQTFALSKTGFVTQRSVVLDQVNAVELNARKMS